MNKEWAQTVKEIEDMQKDAEIEAAIKNILIEQEATRKTSKPVPEKLLTSKSEKPDVIPGKQYGDIEIIDENSFGKHQEEVFKLYNILGIDLKSYLRGFKIRKLMINI